MKTDANPFCPTCQLRLYPQWGPHECHVEPSKDTIARVRHLAGDILSNMHFYRVQADVQMAALCEALAFAVGDNVHPDFAKKKMDALMPTLRKLIDTQVQRVRTDTQSANIVMDVSRPRLTAKKKKTIPVSKRRTR